MHIEEFMSDRPKIGITMRLEIETGRFYLGRDYSEAIEAAGGDPVHIPLIPKQDYIRSLVADLDGVLLPGSDSDVDPKYFGEEPHLQLKRVIPERDETDRLVIAAADELSMPLLAICYGMQAVNVSRGGTLIQDIASQVDDPVKHEQGQPLSRLSHRITYENDWYLAEIADRSNADEGLRVNSHHHQAIGKLGRHLKAMACTHDGIVESFQDTRMDRFILGVQWHPELSWKFDTFSREIFETFVARCPHGSTNALAPVVNADIGEVAH
jgi:putative glutamine amidotransferase